MSKELLDIVVNGVLKQLHALIEQNKNIDINYVDERGCALALAIINNKEEMIYYLVRKGALIENNSTFHGFSKFNSALVLACKMGMEIGIVKLLLMSTKEIPYLMEDLIQTSYSPEWLNSVAILYLHECILRSGDLERILPYFDKLNFKPLPISGDTMFSYLGNRNLGSQEIEASFIKIQSLITQGRISNDEADKILNVILAKISDEKITAHHFENKIKNTQEASLVSSNEFQKLILQMQTINTREQLLSEEIRRLKEENQILGAKVDSISDVCFSLMKTMETFAPYISQSITDEKDKESTQASLEEVRKQLAKLGFKSPELSTDNTETTQRSKRYREDSGSNLIRQPIFTFQNIIPPPAQPGFVFQDVSQQSEKANKQEQNETESSFSYL